MQKQQLVTMVGVLALALSTTAWAGERTVNLKVEGMSCAMCAPAARKALEKVNGVKSATVEGDQASVVADDTVQDAALVKAIEGAGFSAAVAKSSYAIVTVVKAKPGAIDDIAKLFAKTNPALVADQPAWKSARLLADRNSNTVTVIAVWSDPEAYRHYAAGPLRQAMKEFAPHFAAPPSVTVHEILVDM
jgi:copper chaperone CopZ/quinol monooxygenase YgiN